MTKPSIQSLAFTSLLSATVFLAGLAAGKWESVQPLKPQRFDYAITYVTQTNGVSMSFRESLWHRDSEIETFDELNKIREDIRGFNGIGTNDPIIFLMIKRLPF